MAKGENKVVGAENAKQASVSDAVEKQGSDSRQTSRNAGRDVKAAVEDAASSIASDARRQESSLKLAVDADKRAERREEGRVEGALGDFQKLQADKSVRDQVRREEGRTVDETKELGAKEQRAGARDSFREAGKLFDNAANDQVEPIYSFFVCCSFFCATYVSPPHCIPLCSLLFTNAF